MGDHRHISRELLLAARRGQLSSEDLVERLLATAALLPRLQDLSAEQRLLRLRSSLHRHANPAMTEALLDRAPTALPGSKSAFGKHCAEQVVRAHLTTAWYRARRSLPHGIIAAVPAVPDPLPRIAMPPTPDKDSPGLGRVEDVKPHESRRRGRRGGTTTVKPAMIRKTVWLDREVEAALRADAFSSGQSEAELVRRALRAAYGLH
ncbi:MAG: hypothetical protein ACOC83_08220 [Gemmatimonadota bacterium]